MLYHVLEPQSFLLPNNTLLYAFTFYFSSVDGNLIYLYGFAVKNVNILSGVMLWDRESGNRVAWITDGSNSLSLTCQRGE